MLSRSLGREYVCSLVLKMTDRNQTYQNGRVSTHSDVQRGSANRQTSFSGRSNAWMKLSFSGHIANKFRIPTILQLNIEGLTASKIKNLHHLALRSEALVILLQETHCTDAEKLVLPNYQLVGSSLSRKHGLARFVHERLRYTLLDQSPSTSEIEWLCVDVDGYKIVYVYKPPPTPLRSLDLAFFPHSCLSADDFNCRHADWNYDDNNPDVECLEAGQILIVMRLTRTSVTPLRKQPKRLSRVGIEITIFRIGMQSVNPSIKFSCSLLRETTQVWLLQLCLPSLTESRGIDGPRQFGALTFHTLVEKHRVF